MHPNKSLLYITKLICIAFVVGSMNPAHADECVQDGKHKAVTYLLVDRTDKLKDADALKKLLNTARDYMKKRDGERFIVGVISAKTAQTKILMDRSSPEKSVWESSLKLRKQKREFIVCIDKVEKALLKENKVAPASAILETVSFVAEFIQRDPAADKRLIIFSDMVQNSAAVSFYGKRGKEPVEKIMARLVKKKQIPRLDKVVVDIVGTGVGVSEVVAIKVKEFWRQVLGKGGAQLRSYGPVLTDL